MRWQLALLVVCLAPGCRGPVQAVPLDLEAGTRVFVDGREVEPAGGALELRSDRPHVVHLERDGYRAQQVVLEPRKTEVGPRLAPASIRVRLEPIVPKERRIRIEGAESP